MNKQQVLAAVLSMAAVATAQAPQGATVPQLFVSSALPGDKSRTTNTVVIDPPLTLSRDRAGLLHLGLNQTAGAWVLVEQKYSAAEAADLRVPPRFIVLRDGVFLFPGDGYDLDGSIALGGRIHLHSPEAGGTVAVVSFQ